MKEFHPLNFVWRSNHPVYILVGVRSFHIVFVLPRKKSCSSSRCSELCVAQRQKYAITQKLNEFHAEMKSTEIYIHIVQPSLYMYYIWSILCNGIELRTTKTISSIINGWSALRNFPTVRFTIVNFLFCFVFIFCLLYAAAAARAGWCSIIHEKLMQKSKRKFIEINESCSSFHFILIAIMFCFRFDCVDSLFIIISLN